MAHSPDYYAVLGVHPTADRVAIHFAWKALLRRYHPDANHGVDVSARAKEINEAFAVLGKTEARAAYDRSRLPPPSRPTTAHRSVYTAPAGRRPMRASPSLRPSANVAPPLDASQWLMGLLLLLLTAAPLGMILVLRYEETGATYPARGAAAVHHGPETPAKADHTSSGTKPRLRQPRLSKMHVGL